MRDLNNEQCNHSEDLVAFLYHELNESEARSFERHLRECASCERELSSFGEIRESIVSWRDTSLAAAWSRTAENESRVMIPAVAARASAFAAIREFFNLSPLWLKGAAAFASLLFCVCAALAIAYMKTPKTVVLMNNTDKLYTQEDLNKQVADAEKRKEAEIRSVLQVRDSGPSVDTAIYKPVRNVVHAGSYAGNTQNLRKPLTQQERRELAADLGLLSSRDDDDIEFITDTITQTP
jgi:hypothetical protein